ncbi:MAG: hypothetical protein U0T81_13450 [Saprospiraceae bacterium]
MIQSMTPKERANPDLLNMYVRTGLQRVQVGRFCEATAFIKQFEEMKNDVHDDEGQ